MSDNRAFAFGEAICWVTPSGLNSQNVGYISTYELGREPEVLEDGTVAFYSDRLRIDSPWVDDEVVTLFEATGPFSASVRWTNEDDGRLRSASVTGAILENAVRRPGEGGLETFTFTFRARSLK